jgi:hypothetical protein
MACRMTVYAKYQNEQLNMKLMSKWMRNVSNGMHNDTLCKISKWTIKHETYE